MGTGISPGDWMNRERWSQGDGGFGPHSQPQNFAHHQGDLTKPNRLGYYARKLIYFESARGL
jgi:hypothetical protein